MVAINVNGPPTPIAGLPDATVPLPSTAFFVADQTQSGPTVRIPYLQLIADIAAAGGALAISPTSSIASTGGVQSLPGSGGFIFVSNSVSALTLISPTPSPTEGAWFWIMDASGNAGTNSISFSGSLVGDPTLISVSNASSLLVYHSGVFYRLF